MKFIKSLLKSLAYKFLPKKYIIFESVPDCSDNSKAVFDEMLKRGLNKKYKLVWLMSNNIVPEPEIKNVRYVHVGDKNRKWYITLAKCFICCNSFVYSENPKQKSFFLTHGMYVKKPTSYYSLPEEIEYCLSSSEEMKLVQAEALGTDIEKMVALGYPRNDILTAPTRDLKDLFGQQYEKFIVWYPTFRQHNSGMSTGSTYSVPIIWNEKAAFGLNESAKTNKTLIILKPHFAQDVSKIKSLNLSNIILIDDSFFAKNSITSYEFIAGCDSMITDYSSVYFDYTLCDKPIGLVWEDYEEYEKNPGFALDMEYYMKGGVKIYNLEDFTSFITDVADNNDTLKEERREIRDISNYSLDGKSSERVTDFIIREAKL